MRPGEAPCFRAGKISGAQDQLGTLRLRSPRQAPLGLARDRRGRQGRPRSLDQGIGEFRAQGMAHSIKRDEGRAVPLSSRPNEESGGIWLKEHRNREIPMHLEHYVLGASIRLWLTRDDRVGTFYESPQQISSKSKRWGRRITKS